ncbi:MAG: thioesterase family protein [Syntrophobacteraceae bacterium]
MKDRPRFFYPIQVRYIETDMQGHVFFGHYFTYFDVGLIEYLRAIGFGYNDFLDAGVDFFYVAADSQYQGRAFFDETLHVHTHVSNIGNTSFTFEFAIFEELSDRPICTGHIVAVAVDKATREKVRVPDQFRKAVSDFEDRPA